MISPQEIRHIAHLARLELTEEEKQKLEKELSAILEFVEKLDEVDTKKVEPLTGETSLKNIMRPDQEMTKSLEGKAGELLGAAPEKRDGRVRTRAVF